MANKAFTLQEVQEKVTEIFRAVVKVCDDNGIMYYCQAGTVLGAVRHKGPIPWDYDADIIVPENEIDRFVKTCVEQLPSQYWVNFHTVEKTSLNQFPRIGIRGYSTEHLHLDVFRLIGLPDEREEQLRMIDEGVRYRDQMKQYLRGLKGSRHSLKKDGFAASISSVKRLLFKDTSFMDKMEEFCKRYPYESANYVMNPFGKYRAKNIFRKEVYGEGQIVDYLDFKVRIPSDVDPYLRQYYSDYMKTPPEAEIEKMFNTTYEIKEL